MNKYLLIESSTADCSVAICDNNRILDIITIDIPRSQASMLAPSINNILKRTNTNINELSAISVSKGPGSYTGLRVGVSTAKGLCFGKDIPLISVNTLDILADMGLNNINCINTIIIPMIDARRMEVYSASYDYLGNRITEIEAKILDGNSFNDEFAKYDSLIFIGDGANKFKDCLTPDKMSKSLFIECCPSAMGMVKSTIESFNNKNFENPAYFEPLYLKTFVAGTSKKNILGL